MINFLIKFKYLGLLLISLFVTFIFEKYFPHFFYKFIQAINNFFSTTINIPLWFFVTLSLCIVGLLSILISLYWINTKKPEWIKYISDNFDGVNWEWRYYNFAPYDIKINSIGAFCPRDQTPLVLRRTPHSYNYTNQFCCETCDFISSEFTEEGQALKEKIIRRIIGKMRVKFKV